jgi:hypothetical protein
VLKFGILGQAGEAVGYAGWPVAASYWRLADPPALPKPATYGAEGGRSAGRFGSRARGLSCARRSGQRGRLMCRSGAADVVWRRSPGTKIRGCLCRPSISFVLGPERE